MFMRTFGYASGHPDSVAYVWLQVVLSFMGSLYSILTPPPSSLPPYSFPPPSTHFLSSFLSPSSPSSPSSSSSSFCSFNHIYTTQSILNGVGPHLLCSNRWDFGHSVPLSDSGSSIHVTYLQRCRSSVSNPSQEIETFFFQNKFFFLFKIFSWLLSRLKPASENLPKNDNNNKLHLKFLRSRFSICLFAHLAVVVCELGFCGCLLMRWFRCLLMSMCLCLFVCLFAVWHGQDAIAISGGIIGAMRIPEKWFPGRFDFWFNSHHIMHVLVLVAVVHMHNAAKLDMIWLTNPQCPSISSHHDSHNHKEL